MTDIVERLRQLHGEPGHCAQCDAMRLAADEIERLRKEVAVLEKEYGQPFQTPEEARSAMQSITGITDIMRGFEAKDAASNRAVIAELRELQGRTV